MCGVWGYLPLIGPSWDQLFMNLDSTGVEVLVSKEGSMFPLGDTITTSPNWEFEIAAWTLLGSSGKKKKMSKKKIMMLVRVIVPDNRMEITTQPEGPVGRTQESPCISMFSWTG